MGTCIPDPTDKVRAQQANQQHAPDDEEHARDASLGLNGDTMARSPGAHPSRIPASIAVPSRALMALLVEMRNVVPVAKGILAGAHAPHSPPPATTTRRARSRRAGGAGALLVRRPPLLALRAPAPRAEETWRWSRERAAALA